VVAAEKSPEKGKRRGRARKSEPAAAGMKVHSLLQFPPFQLLFGVFSSLAGQLLFLPLY
jgi:hypothetical protein